MPQASRVGRAAFVCGTAYLLLAAYALSRPIVESLFLDVYGSATLPLVWGVVTVAMTAVVLVYNRFARRTPLLVLFTGALLINAAALAVLLLLHQGTQAREVVFALYVWKDVYIIVLLEVLWSLANVVFSVQTARWFYGLVLFSGALGGITGNLAAGVVADRLGTERSAWLVVPILLVLAAMTQLLRRTWAFVPRPEPSSTAPLREAARLLRSSPYLKWMMALVAIVQIVVTLVDYQFNVMLEQAVTDLDERTAVLGYVYAAVDASSAVLQVTSAVILRYAGVGLSLLGVPVLLGAAMGAFWMVPTVTMIAVVKTTSKALDYSIFKAAKEILYIPLGYAEKTRGKALVDMFTYRMAKGAASLLVLGLGAATAFDLAPLTLALVVAWVLVTMQLVRAWRRAASESSGDG